MVVMNGDDLEQAKGMHRAGLMPLRAAAWVLLRYREQIPGRTATADDIASEFGCHRVSAFRALREIRAFQVASHDATHKPVADSATPSSDIGYSATRPVAESATPSSGIGYPPTPPYKERDLEREERSATGRVAESATGLCVHAEEPFALPDPPPQPPGPPGFDSAEAEALEGWAEAFGYGTDGEPVSMLARSLCNHFRSDWIELAIRMKDQWGEQINRRVLTTVLRAWERRGEPEPRYTAAPAARACPARGAPPTRPGNPALPDVDRWYTEEDRAS